jgi:hypothetical protein
LTKRFFILGDSWGCGEWTLDSGQFESVPDTGIDYHLAQLGHTVTNISAGSAGNFGQLRRAYWTLKEKSDYDYIIWFHTESMRDIEEFLIKEPIEAKIQFPKFKMSLNFNSVLRYINQQNYQYAQNLYDEYQIPFIVVNGQSPLDTIIDNYSFVKHTIPWLVELLNLNFDPPPNTFFGWEKIQRILEHYSVNEKQFITNNIVDLDKSKIIVDLAKKSKNFPDDGHPSSDCFKQLANRVLIWCNDDKQA